MGRTQRVDDKIGLICLVMFSPTFIVIKMSQMAYFLYFLLATPKNTHSLCKILKCIRKISFSSFRKCYVLLLSSELPLTRCKTLKIQDLGIPLLTQQFF